MNERKYIRIAEIQDVYGISRSTIYRHVNAGKLKIRKLGSASLLKVSELEGLIEDQEVAAT